MCNSGNVGNIGNSGNVGNTGNSSNLFIYLFIQLYSNISNIRILIMK